MSYYFSKMPGVKIITIDDLRNNTYEANSMYRNLDEDRVDKLVKKYRSKDGRPDEKG